MAMHAHPSPSPSPSAHSNSKEISSQGASPVHTSLARADSDVSVRLLLLLLFLLALARAHTHLTQPAPLRLLSNTCSSLPVACCGAVRSGDDDHFHFRTQSHPHFRFSISTMPRTTTTTSRRRKRGGDEGDAAAAADGTASSKAASVLTSLDAPRPELPLFQLTHQAPQDDDDVDEVTGGAAAPAGSSSSSAPAAAAAAAHGPHQQRRLWVKDRSRAWWDQCSSADYPEPDFRAAFRMGRATFAMLCDALGAAVAKEDTALRAAIPVRQRVAVCVWRLATGEPLRLVSKRFGLGISTCHKLVLEVCAAIRGLLMPRFLRWPDDAEADGFKARFLAESGIPGVVGAIHTTHVPIIAPKTSVAAYFNRRHTERNHRTSYSVTLQGVVGPDGAFTDVCIGWPGSMPDDQVLERSALQQRAAAGMMPRGAWVVGGASFPLTDWVLAPYARGNLTWAQHAFNEKAAEVRRVAVEAVARLKGRWACLQKRTEVKLQDLPVVLGACCVLHNICEARGEAMDPALRFHVDDDDETVPENPVRSNAAAKARDDIAHNLLHSGRAGTNFF